MFIEDLAKVIYGEGTASEDTPVTVRPYNDYDRVLWKGKAKDLQNQRELDGLIVVEVLVDKSDGKNDLVPVYNRGKAITVV